MRHVPGFAPGRRGDEDTAFPPHPALSHQGRGKERHKMARLQKPATSGLPVVVVAASRVKARDMPHAAFPLAERGRNPAPWNRKP